MPVAATQTAADARGAFQEMETSENSQDQTRRLTEEAMSLVAAEALACARAVTSVAVFVTRMAFPVLVWILTGWAPVSGRDTAAVAL